MFDVARSNFLIAQNIKVSRNQVYNVGSGKTISINELARMFGSPIEYIDERKGEAKITHANINKILQLGWTPLINLKNAIKKELI